MQNRTRSIAGLLALAVLSSGVAVSLSLGNADAALAKSCKKGSKKSCKKACKGNDIVSTAKKAGTFNTLGDALDKANLTGTLQKKGPYTVFAPSDSAFAKLPKEEKEALLNDEKRLPEVLKYHVVQGIVPSSDLASARAVTTIQGESLMVDNKDGSVIVDGAIVTKPDIKCSNGVIHEIDYILVPERGK